MWPSKRRSLSVCRGCAVGGLRGAPCLWGGSSAPPVVALPPPPPARARASQVLVPQKVNAVLGKNVTLECQVEVGTNLSLTQSSWERRLPTGAVTVAVYNPLFGISVPPEYEGRLTFRSPSSHDATILLSDVGFSDMGVYTCKVATFPLGNTQAATTVNVLVEPKVSLSAGPGTLVDGGNETVVATCTAERARPPAEVSWESALFGQSDVQLWDEPNGTTSTRVRYRVQAHHNATDSRDKERGLTCVVRHKPRLDRGHTASPTSSTCSLNVLCEDPYLILPYLNLTHRIPYQLNVLCEDPYLILPYLNLTHRIPYQLTCSLNVLCEDPYLILPYLNLTHRIPYQLNVLCEDPYLILPYLNLTHRIPYQLNVLYAPDISVVGYDGDWYVGRENVQLTCRANANPPAHHFRWIRLDSDVWPDGVERLNNTLLFLRPLQRNDSGVYRCEVANSIDLRSRDLRILIQGHAPSRARPLSCTLIRPRPLSGTAYPSEHAHSCARTPLPLPCTSHQAAPTLAHVR
ncbi:unnamed protein product [Boreogadus saida]